MGARMYSNLCDCSNVVGTYLLDEGFDAVQRILIMNKDDISIRVEVRGGSGVDLAAAAKDAGYMGFCS